jgi:hypothetical protein
MLPWSAVDAADQVEHRGLAGAVGADQGEHLALPDIEAHVVDGQHAAEARTLRLRADSSTSAGSVWIWLI